jgi:hypothetical protein
MADPAILTFHESLKTVYPFVLPLPRPAAADYNGSYRSYIHAHNPATASFFTRLTTTHTAYLQTLPPYDRPIEQQIAGLEDYLKEVRVLHASLAAHRLELHLPKIKLDKELVLDWRLYLKNGDGCRSNELEWEIVMLYHQKVSYLRYFSLSH